MNYFNNSSLNIFNSCGNIVGVVSLNNYPNEEKFPFDYKLRSDLVKWGEKTNLDSIMVLIGNPKLAAIKGFHYYMYVFEPRGNNNKRLLGTISAMCGNGLRAVAAYLKETNPKIKNVLIMTSSGLRKVRIQKNQYIVEMGKLTCLPLSLSKYINISIIKPNSEGIFIDSLIPEQILKKINKITLISGIKTWSIGLTGSVSEDKIIDGEPHVVIQIPSSKIKDIKSLQKLAIKVGPIITKNLRLFPKEINVNFIVKQIANKRLSILNCTHERNLGNNPHHSVTASCGTGSTVAGAIMLTNNKLKKIIVKCLGGRLIIEKRQSQYYLHGSAVRYNKR